MIQEQKPTRIEITDGASIPDPSDKRLLTAWSISFYGALLALVCLCVFIPDPYYRILTFLPDGIAITFEVTICSILLSLPLGLLTGLGKLSRNRIINLLASTYVEVVRGLPLLVQLFYIYFALGRFLKVPDMVAAIIAMSICYGAYMGEVFRAGIESIDKGQVEAAKATGLDDWQTMRYVIFPQALRRIIPPVTGQFVSLIKDSSLLSVISVRELTKAAEVVNATTFKTFEAYLPLAGLYLLLTYPLSYLTRRLEKRLSRE